MEKYLHFLVEVVTFEVIMTFFGWSHDIWGKWYECGFLSSGCAYCACSSLDVGRHPLRNYIFHLSFNNNIIFNILGYTFLITFLIFKKTLIVAGQSRTICLSVYIKTKYFNIQLHQLITARHPNILC